VDNNIPDRNLQDIIIAKGPKTISLDISRYFYGFERLGCGFLPANH